MELLDLPNELLLAIVVLIGGFDILPCRLVSESVRFLAVPTVSSHRRIYINQQQFCKRVQKLIDHSAKSQLSIELASECLALAPWNDEPAGTLLDRLRRSREAWRTLRPTREKIIPLRGDIYRTHEACGYVFAQGKPGQIGSQATRMLKFGEMPVGGLMKVEGEEEEGTRGRHREYVDMGMDVVGFTFDPSQDALFLVEKQGFVDTRLSTTLPKIELYFPPADNIQQPAPPRRQNDQDGHGWPTRASPVRSAN
jgi:hypothetical protein